MIALVVEAAFRSLALGAVVWLAMAAIRPRNPHVHKTVWSTVVLASIAMPFLIAFSMAPNISAPAFSSVSTFTLQLTGDEMAQVPPHWMRSATALYGLAVFALMVRFAIGLVRMGRIARRATVVNERWVGSDDVRVTAELRRPATFGSTILLPIECSAWSSKKLAAVMAHERSHVMRKDCYVLWIARLHASVFWINPLAWWMLGRLAELAETTSDDAVVAELGDRPAYAEVLLEIAAAPSATRALTAVEMSGSRLSVTKRIERIISGISPAVVPRRVHQFLVALLVLPAVMASATELHGPEPLKVAQAKYPGMNPPNPNPVDQDPMAPRFLSGDMDLEKYYPPEAKRLGIEGVVTVQLQVDADGATVGSTVIVEEPADLGLGAAAQALVSTFRFTNPRHAPTAFPMKVKFSLKKDAPLPPPPNPAGG